MLTYALTWFTEFGAWKMPLIFLFVVAILKICYKDTVYQIVTVTEVWFVVIVFLSEAIYFSIGYLLFGSNQSVQVDGQTFLRWENPRYCICSSSARAWLDLFNAEAFQI